MKTKKIGLSIMIISVLSIVLCNCEQTPQEKEPLDYAYKNSAWVIDEENDTPLVGFHEDGSVVSIQADPNSDMINAFYQKNMDSPGFYVVADSRGYPVRAFFDGIIFLFENYDNNKVDVATIMPNGDIEIERGIEFNFPTTSNYGDLKSMHFNPEEMTWGEALHIGSLALSVGLCVASIITAPAHLGIGTYLACGAAIVKIGIEFVPDDNEALKNSGKAAVYIAKGFGCVGHEVGSCVSLVVMTADEVVNYYEEKAEENASQIQLAQGGLTSPIENVPADINEFINEELLGILIEKGFTVNPGFNPPNVEGYYFTNSLTNWETSNTYMDYTYKFTNQTSLLEIGLEYVNETGTSTAVSDKAFISGLGDNFSLFAEIKTVHNEDSHIVKLTTATIITGIYASGGIVDFKFGFMVTAKSNDLDSRFMNVGQSRIIYESDLLAEKVYSYPFAGGAARKSNSDTKSILLKD